MNTNVCLSVCLLSTLACIAAEGIHTYVHIVQVRSSLLSKVAMPTPFLTEIASWPVVNGFRVALAKTYYIIIAKYSAALKQQQTELLHRDIWDAELEYIYISCSKVPPPSRCLVHSDTESVNLVLKIGQIFKTCKCYLSS